MSNFITGRSTIAKVLASSLDLHVVRNLFNYAVFDAAHNDETGFIIKSTALADFKGRLGNSLEKLKAGRSQLFTKEQYELMIDQVGLLIKEIQLHDEISYIHISK